MSVIKLAKMLTLEGHPDLALEMLAFLGDRQDLAQRDFIPSVLQTLLTNPYQKKHIGGASKLFKNLEVIQPFIIGRSKNLKRPVFYTYTDGTYPVLSALRKSPQWTLVSSNPGKFTTYRTKKTSKGGVLVARLGRKNAIEVFLASPGVDLKEVDKKYNYFQEGDRSPEGTSFVWKPSFAEFVPGKSEPGAEIRLRFDPKGSGKVQAPVDVMVKRILPALKLEAAKKLWVHFDRPTAIRTIEDACKLVGKSPELSVSSGDIRSIESTIGVKLPDSYKKALPLCVGGEVEYLEVISPSQILGNWELMTKLLDDGDFWNAEADSTGPVKADWWNRKWVPITHDGAGDHICLDYDPAPGGKVGQVISFWHDAGTREVLAPDFATWLITEAQKMRAKMTEKRYDSFSQFLKDTEIEYSVLFKDSDVAKMDLSDFETLTDGIDDLGLVYDIARYDFK